MRYDKKFLVLGNMNAITYKEIFSYIKDNKLWPGIYFNRTMEFEVLDYYNTSKAIEKDGEMICIFIRRLTNGKELNLRAISA